VDVEARRQAMMTVAAKQFKRDGFKLMAVYFVIYFGCFAAHLWWLTAERWMWLLAVLPVLPIVGVIAVMGKYLRLETDEFKREVLVRCLLWGCAGAVSVSLMGGFLWIFGWKGHMPPFLGFWVFFAFTMAAKLTYRVKNRVPDDADALVGREGVR
jgi:hypothetical protein